MEEICGRPLMTSLPENASCLSAMLMPLCLTTLEKGQRWRTLTLSGLWSRKTEVRQTASFFFFLEGGWHQSAPYLIINWAFFQLSKWQASGKQIQVNITIHNSSYLFLSNNKLCILQYWDHILKHNFYLNLAELIENKCLLPWSKVQGKHYYRRQCVLPVAGNPKVEMYVLCPP